MSESKMFNKFLFLFYLVISSSILNVHSKIENSHEIANFLNSIYSNSHDLTFLDDPLPVTRGGLQAGESIETSKLLNFILGMMRKIPKFRNYSILFESLIDRPDKPECASLKFHEQYQSIIINEELIQMAKQQETDKIITDIMQDLGEKDEIKNLDWTHPKEACKTVLKVHKERYTEIKKTLEKSQGLSVFALKVYTNNESFEEFYTKIGSGLTKLFHRQRIKLYDFILKINFNGDSEKMKRVYKDYGKWREDLNQLYMILQENDFASREIQESILSEEEALPDCDILPSNNELEKETKNFIAPFVGGLMALKQVAVCLGVDTMIFVTLFSFGIMQIVKLIAMIFGLIFAKIIVISLLLTQFSYFLYKGIRTDEATQLKKKYRYYGKAAGVMFNLLCSLLGLN
jgi:hypothetical protein